MIMMIQIIMTMVITTIIIIIKSMVIITIKKIYKIDNIVTCSNHNLIIIYCSNMTGRYYDD